MDDQEEMKARLEIARLLQKKDGRFLRIQRMHEMIDHLKDPKVRLKFDALRETLDETVKEFDEIMHQLIALRLEVDDDFADDSRSMEEFTELVAAIRREADEKPKVEEASRGSFTAFRLPEITLPTFDGDPEEWPAFYYTFRDLIHSNEAVNDATKVLYLAGCLKGLARSVCAGFKLTAENYPKIWNKLVEKYQVPRQIAFRYLRLMLELRPLASESSEGLYSVVDTFLNPFRALKQLELPDLADFIVATLALTKLDDTTRRDLLSEHPEMPTLEEVIEFVRRRADALHLIELSRKPPAASSCPLCEEAHAIYSCSSFAKASKSARWEITKRYRLCFNCLSDHHMLSSCKSTNACRKCQKRHHSMLHRG